MNVPGMNENAVTKGMELRLDLAIHGIETAFPAHVVSITLRGVTYTRDELAKKLTEVAKPWKDARAAHEFLRQFAQDKPDHFKVAQEILADFKAALCAHIGRENEQLARFGFTPMTRSRPLTVEEKVLRTAKAKLTRQMRGTLGRRQREELRASDTPTVSIGPDAKLEVIEPKPPANERPAN